MTRTEALVLGLAVGTSVGLLLPEARRRAAFRSYLKLVRRLPVAR